MYSFFSTFFVIRALIQIASLTDRASLFVGDRARARARRYSRKI